VKAKITIKGRRVQDISYRLFLLSKAHSLKGFEAANVGEDLIVLIEGNENTVNKFIGFGTLLELSWQSGDY